MSERSITCCSGTSTGSRPGDNEAAGGSVTHRRDVRLVWSTVVVGHESVQLQGVELEAGVVDVLHVLHGVFVHGQQGGGLEHTTPKHYNQTFILHQHVISASKIFRCQSYKSIFSIYILLITRNLLQGI